ncbi:MAG TPA: hypothetical protein VFF37_10670, partial [Streptomyces sp.]|nr:hypothetical protein [Streptomyces sp.]
SAEMEPLVGAGPGASAGLGAGAPPAESRPPSAGVEPSAQAGPFAEEAPADQAMPPARTASPAQDAPPVHTLPTRVRQASLVAPLREPRPTTADGPERDVSPEEMRSIFGAFQRGLDRGRKGDTVGPASPGAAPRPRTTDEGTDDDV